MILLNRVKYIMRKLSNSDKNKKERDFRYNQWRINLVENSQDLESLLKECWDTAWKRARQSNFHDPKSAISILPNSNDDINGIR